MALARDTFIDRGVRWTRHSAETEERFVVGVDLGQSTDPTAIAVLHWRRIPLTTWTPREGANGSGSITQDRETRFDVRHLERLPLGTPYPDIVAYVGELLSRKPLSQFGADLVIDETGVGRAVADLFDDHGLDPVRVAITAGAEVTQQGSRRYHVAKSALISQLDALLHVGELKFAADLLEADAMANELKDFRRRVTDAGRSSYAARTGRHDDLVLAVAIACWWAANRATNQVTVGTYVGWY